MSYDKNVYDNPEKFNLKIVTEWDYSDKCYCFDSRIVWRKENGDLVTARDSGCSCPTPFEDKGLNDLISVSKAELKQEAIDEAKGDGYGGDPLSDILAKIEALK